VIATRAVAKVVKSGGSALRKPVDAEDIRRAGKGKNIKLSASRKGRPTLECYGRRCLPLRSRTNWVHLLIVDTVASLAACAARFVDNRRASIFGFVAAPKKHQRGAGRNVLLSRLSPSAEEDCSQAKGRKYKMVCSISQTRYGIMGQRPGVSSHATNFTDLRVREAMRLVVEERP